MSDDRMPAWAVAMEQRLSGWISSSANDLRMSIDGRLVDIQARMETRSEADAREHHLVAEIGKAINDSETRLTRRLDEIRDDIAVNMARADLAHTKIDTDRAEVASLRREMTGLYRRLQDVEHRLFKGEPKPPEAA